MSVNASYIKDNLTILYKDIEDLSFSVTDIENKSVPRKGDVVRLVQGKNNLVPFYYHGEVLYVIDERGTDTTNPKMQFSNRTTKHRICIVVLRKLEVNLNRNERNYYESLYNELRCIKKREVIFEKINTVV